MTEYHVRRPHLGDTGDNQAPAKADRVLPPAWWQGRKTCVPLHLCSGPASPGYPVVAERTRRTRRARQVQPQRRQARRSGRRSGGGGDCCCSRRSCSRMSCLSNWSRRVSPNASRSRTRFSNNRSRPTTSRRSARARTRSRAPFRTRLRTSLTRRSLPKPYPTSRR